MPKLIPIVKRNPMNHCWFCGTNKSVKYTGKILNPNPMADNRYLNILVCNKCCALHTHHFAEYWKEDWMNKDN